MQPARGQQSYQKDLKEIPPEFAAALLRGLKDPVFFCKFFCGIEPFAGFDKDNNRISLTGQVGWLTQNILLPERILSTGNRWGKSIITACKHLWMMFYKIRRNPIFNKIFEYRTVNVAITIEQAKIVWEEAVRIVTSRPQLSWALAKGPIRKPFPALVFSNGALFTCRSTDQPANLWGPWYDYASYDEAACEKKPSETIPLLKTRLMDHDGLLDYISTPAYTKNWFFKLKEKAKLDPESYFLLTGSSKENPYISAEARSRFMEKMTKEQVLVHVEGEDIDAGGYVFKSEYVERARTPEMQLIEYTPDEKYIHAPHFPGHRYLEGWDIATKKDALVGITVDVTDKPYKVVALERYKRIPWSFVYAKVRERHNMYHAIKKIDVTGVGDHLPEELSDLKDYVVPVNFSKGKIKTDMIINTQKILEDSALVFPHIPCLIEQLTFYEWDDKDLETDCVIALCLALFDISPDYAFSGDASEIKIGDPMVSVEIKEDLKVRSKIYA